MTEQSAIERVYGAMVSATKQTIDAGKPPTVEVMAEMVGRMAVAAISALRPGDLLPGGLMIARISKGTLQAQREAIREDREALQEYETQFDRLEKMLASFVSVPDPGSAPPSSGGAASIDVSQGHGPDREDD